MNIEKLHNIINMLNVAGITQANLINEDGKITIFGADDVEEGDVSPSIVVISETDNDVTDTSMGIHRVPVILKRMNLFNVDNMKETHTVVEHENYMSSIIFKEGRRKASYTFADPKSINVPTGCFQDNILETLTITKEYVDQINRANTAMGSKLLTLKSINKDVILELYDEISDTFTEVIGTFDGADWSYSWKTNSVLRLLRHAIKVKDEVTIEVGELGILYMNISGIRFMVMPQVI